MAPARHLLQISHLRNQITDLLNSSQNHELHLDLLRAETKHDELQQALLHQQQDSKAVKKQVWLPARGAQPVLCET
jgi:predicted  nucleic acid-binding Zn-ribbon protein